MGIRYNIHKDEINLKDIYFPVSTFPWNHSEEMDIRLDNKKHVK